MNQQLVHQTLVGRIHAFNSILQDRGIAFELPSDLELEKMPDSDLSDLVRMLRDIARTPVQG